jgi:RNA polymerase sigma factor (sigma-70 family)
MRHSNHDLLRIPENELPRLTQDELLRTVVICRGSDDKQKTHRAGRAWDELVAHDIDRVRGLVESFRFPKQANVRVHRDDVDQVVHDCWLRLRSMLGTFRGTSEGEYRAAMKTCVNYQCMDDCRSKMAQEKRIAGSLDDGITDKEGDVRPRFEHDVGKLEERRLAEEKACERNAEIRRRVRDAIESIDNENRRQVLLLTIDGRSTEEIASELDTSADNVYQLRRRGLKMIRDMFDGDEPLEEL